jgi:hypothetical protein
MWMGKAVEEFGIATLDVKALIDWMKVRLPFLQRLLQPQVSVVRKADQLLVAYQHNLPGVLITLHGQADLASTNAAVRTAAVAVLGTCHRQLGPGLAAMIRPDVKPALMATVDEAFGANPQQQVLNPSLSSSVTITL